MQGLLHEEKPAAVEQGPQRRLALIRLPVLAEGGDVSVLFVAVQGEPEAGRGGFEHLGHCVQSRDVRLQATGHLDLEVRQPVRGRGVGEGVGQPVGDVLLGCDLVAQQGISQTDGVAGDDRGERLGKPVGRLASCQFRMDRAELDAEQVLMNRARERGLAPAAEGIDRRPFHQAGSEVGQQRRDLLPAGPGCLLRVQPVPERKHRIVCGTGDQVGGVPDDAHHRRQVLLEPRARVLGEPLRRQSLGGETGARRSINRTAQQHEHVRNLGHGRDPVPERKAGAHPPGAKGNRIDVQRHPGVPVGGRLSQPRSPHDRSSSATSNSPHDGGCFWYPATWRASSSASS